MNLQPALLQRLRRFRKRLRRLQADVTAANIHDFRIACREVLACYPLLKRVTPAQHWKPFLKNALHALNSLRDLQQLQEQLLQQQLLRPSLVHSTIEKPIEKATQRWLRYAPTLQSPEFLKALAATEQSLVISDSLSETLQATFEKQWKKALHLTHDSLVAADTADLKSLHRLRIRYKKLRYLLELLENDLSPSSQKETLKQWQDMLGEVQDFHIMAKLAKKLGLPASLHEEFLRHADELARNCIARRVTLAQFLLCIDDQVRALP